jgi:hypothetical protein
MEVVQFNLDKSEGVPMRFFVLVFVAFCILGLCQVAPAQNQTWQTISIPGICTYQIPPSVEIQRGTYKELSDKFLGLVLEIEASPDQVIAQPKGINSFDPQALKRYCRIIVETDHGRRGQYKSLDSPFAVSEQELLELDAILKQQIQQAATMSTAKGMKMVLLSWQPVKIVRVNGIDTLKTTFSRSVNDGPPAVVSMYLVQNNDCMHRITISYRLSEKSLWARDLEKVIDTFSFKKR